MDRRTEGPRAELPHPDRSSGPAPRSDHPLDRGEAEQLEFALRIPRPDGTRVVATAAPGPPVAPGVHWMCVVAEDRPGLLALLSAAITAHSYDLVEARVHCRVRAPDGPIDAVDLFALRRRKGHPVPLRADEIAALAETMDALLGGELDVAALEKQGAPTVRPGQWPEPRAWFVETEGAPRLVVEAPDRPGLLRTLARTIFDARLTIVRSRVTTAAATAHDEFDLAELDGRPLSAVRRVAILSAIRAALRSEAPRSGRPPQAG